jgi:hypothetical protein
VTTRVTRRLEEWDQGSDRLSTSEYFQQLIESDTTLTPKVKASQAYTKYKWRSAEVAGDGPEIVATQVVSDYTEPAMGDDPKLLIGGRGKPVTVYTYKMAFRRQTPSESL